MEQQPTGATTTVIAPKKKVVKKRKSPTASNAVENISSQIEEMTIEQPPQPPQQQTEENVVASEEPVKKKKRVVKKKEAAPPPTTVVNNTTTVESCGVDVGGAGDEIIPCPSAPIVLPTAPSGAKQHKKINVDTRRIEEVLVKHGVFNTKNVLEVVMNEILMLDETAQQPVVVKTASAASKTTIETIGKQLKDITHLVVDRAEFLAFQTAFQQSPSKEHTDIASRANLSVEKTAHILIRYKDYVRQFGRNKI